MPIGLENFNPETFEQANPALAAYGITIANQQTALQNQALSQQLPYVGAMAAAQLSNAQAQPALTRAQTAVQNANVPNIQAQTQQIQQGQIPLQQAQAASARATAAATQFSLAHPEYMVPQSYGGQIALANDLAPETQTNNVSTTQPPGTSPLPPPLSAPAPGTPTGSMTVDPNSATGLVKSLMFAAPKAEMARANLFNQEAQNIVWKNIPQPQQATILAQTAGMGISPQEAIQDTNNGLSLGDIATKNGFDPNNLPTPVYPLSQQSVTRMQNRTVADAEMSKMQSFVTAGIAPYSTNIDGYSPKLTADMLSGNNSDQVANAIAAKALVPELSAMRLKIMNSDVGITAIQEVTEAANNNLKNFGITLKPAVYKQAQGLIADQINQAFKAGNDAITKAAPTSPQQAQANQQQSQSSQPQSGTVRVIRSDGQSGTIPASQLNSFLANGYKQANG